MVNSIIGGGIFGLPSILAARLGALSPLSCLCAGIGVLIIAGCIAEVSSRYEETGGLYLYARDALGRFAGLLVAWLTWLTRIAAPAAVANLFCTYLAQFFPALGTRRASCSFWRFLLGHLAFLNYVGVKAGKNLSNFFTVVKAGFLLFFVLAGLLVLLLRPEIRVPLTCLLFPQETGLKRYCCSSMPTADSKARYSSAAKAQIRSEIRPSHCCSRWSAVAVIYTGGAICDGRHASRRRIFGQAAFRCGTALSWARREPPPWRLAALVSAYGYLSANLVHSPRITFAMAEHGDFPCHSGRDPSQISHAVLFHSHLRAHRFCVRSARQFSMERHAVCSLPFGHLWRDGQSRSQSCEAARRKSAISAAGPVLVRGTGVAVLDGSPDADGAAANFTSWERPARLRCSTGCSYGGKP